ncbi:hypothetical protein Bca52824_071322 [Brassica carinata]|uniref:Uncharacterized protein n=1 Tax=Brassica carinata TaxID=52824 RepID=A0A8X7Q9U9_BRACI|nr:hypothetical protein Bca52824_071322 [Brassica carinata]
MRNFDSDIEELQRLESNENSDDVAPTAVRTSRFGENRKLSVLSTCKAIGISQNVDSVAAEHFTFQTLLVMVRRKGNQRFAKGMSTANVDRSMTEKMSDDSDRRIVSDRKVDVTSVVTGTSVPAECKATDFGAKVDSLAVANSPSDVVSENKKEQKPPVVLSSELVKEMGADIPVSSLGSPYVERLVTKRSMTWGAII